MNYFAALTKQYCDWVEAEPLDLIKELFRARVLLAKLYAAALMFPENKDFILAEKEAPNIINIDIVHKRLRELPFQYYWETLDLFSVAPEAPGVGDITDDLVDIYRDLKEGLWYFENNLTTDAAFHWKLSFDAHWGGHAVNALQALHSFSVLK